MSDFSFPLPPDVDFVCANDFEGGGWLLVRYRKLHSYGWHRANDGMRGVDEYGYPGLIEYSIYFKHMMRPETELLFAVGMF
jgi:hypothetical protein